MSTSSFFVLSPALSERIWSNLIVTEPLESSFMPDRVVSLKWEILLEFFQDLRKRPVTSEQEFERYLLDLCEIESQLHDAYQHHHSLKADSAGAEAATIFEENIGRYEVLWENQRQYVYERLIAMPWLADPKPEWQRLATVLEGRVRNFNWDHYSLEIEEDRVTAQVTAWEDLIEAETFGHLGDECGDREIWYSEGKAIRQHEAEVVPLLSNLIGIRQAQAARVGSDYFNYALTAQDTFDYSADQVVEVAQAVLKHFSPVAAHCLQRRLLQNEETQLVPWSDNQDAEIPYNKKLGKAEYLEARLKDFLQRLSPDIAELYERNRSRFTLDFYEREEKDPQSFISSYARLGKLYLTTSLDGSARSLSDVFHEISHLLETVAAIHHGNYHYRNHPPEIAEGLAMGMELISMDSGELFLRPTLITPAKRQVLEEQILLLTNNCAEVLFESWLYTDGAQKSDRWGARWSELADKATPGIHWEECAELRPFQYLGDMAMYKSPFAGVNYILGGLNAFSLFLNHRNNPVQTGSQIYQAYLNGDSDTLPKLYQAAGIPFRFDSEYVKSLADFIGQILRSY